MKILLLAVLLIVFLVFMFPFTEVVGNSMLPTYHSGDILLSRRVLFKKLHRYKDGDVYVLRTQYSDRDFLIVKRVSFLYKDDKDTMLYLCGDNPKESYDSRMYGSVSSKLVVAKVLFILKHKE